MKVDESVTAKFVQSCKSVCQHLLRQVPGMGEGHLEDADEVVAPLRQLARAQRRVKVVQGKAHGRVRAERLRLEGRPAVAINRHLVGARVHAPLLNKRGDSVLRADGRMHRACRCKVFLVSDVLVCRRRQSALQSCANFGTADNCDKVAASVHTANTGSRCTESREDRKYVHTLQHASR